MATEASQKRFNPPPRLMVLEDYVAKFGGVYESSPWVAKRARASGLTEAHDTVEGLASLMAWQVEDASVTLKRDLICAHPDLAGKAAVAGELTPESRSEQASAGLDRCTPEELARFRELNAAYKAKFHFPFIIAVAGLDRAAILEAFERRLENDVPAEFCEALEQINRIARLRLEALAE